MELLKKAACYKKILSDVNSFVADKLKNYSAKGVESKTIHDPIWGSTEYAAWEMQIIDSPLIQRLRNISQVGLAVLTYPTARHSRFEHTLGVAAATKRMVAKINSNGDNKISSDVLNKLVLTAIMHDVGHCFYSHLSEKIYGKQKDFFALRKFIEENYFVKPKPHEILSLIIVNSPAFLDFFEHQVNYPDKNNVSKLAEDVGKIIIGVNIVDGNTINSYQTAIINGPFDVDKLDYIKRDSYTAGLALNFDIERLFTKVLIHDVKSNTDDKIEKRLVIKASGVAAVEELTFCKLMLFSYIYYHPKVMITEYLIMDFVKALLELNLIDSYADFLKYTDQDLFELAKQQNNKEPFHDFGHVDLETWASNIKYRKLPKRCIEISQGIIQQAMTKSQVIENQSNSIATLYSDFKNNMEMTQEEFGRRVGCIISNTIGQRDNTLSKFLSRYEQMTYQQLLNVRKKIYKKLCALYAKQGMNVNFDVFDIYFVLPSIVSYGPTDDKIILSKSLDLLTVNDYVKLDQWASSFNSNKWRGYVFVSDKIDKNLALEACDSVILQNKVSLNDLKLYVKL